MPYTLKLDTKLQAVEVNASGLLNQDIRKDILSSVAEQAEIHQITRVLIDLTESSFDPTEFMTGAVELVNFMRSLNIPPDVRFALLYTAGEASEHRQLFEVVAQLDGRKLRYFTKRPEAVSWLLS